jgi:hypothetical protein
MERYAMMAQDRSAKFPKIVAVVMSLLIWYQVINRNEAKIRRLAQKARQVTI